MSGEPLVTGFHPRTTHYDRPISRPKQSRPGSPESAYTSDEDEVELSSDSDTESTGRSRGRPTERSKEARSRRDSGIGSDSDDDTKGTERPRGRRAVRSEEPRSRRDSACVLDDDKKSSGPPPPPPPRRGTKKSAEPPPLPDKTDEDLIDKYIKEVVAGSKKTGKDGKEVEVTMPEAVKKLTKAEADAMGRKLTSRADTLKQAKGVVLQEMIKAEKEGASKEEIAGLREGLAHFEEEESKLGGVAQKTEAQAKGKMGRAMEKPLMVAFMQIIIPMAMFLPLIIQAVQWAVSKCSSNNSNQVPT